ncbi:thiamine monophosphate synthase [Corynebacterium maris DSM 45190]|uniref:Thiamine-phosphate synthase n=1 Tax=Corynebacterium maris DSM 45190 TaxID=1224163 RepID=S5SUS8_9CORY|nr:thiamine monophosphate synthase [Corynebacterium maris DSM 45190]
MSPVDWSLYLVTDPVIGGGDVVETVAQALDGGVSVVQLRDKHAGDDEFRRTTEQLLEILGEVPLFLNDRAHIAAEFRTHLHIGQDDVAYAQARELLHEDQLIGLSVGSDAELDAALALPGRRPDVLGLGPVYSTTTKTNAPAGVGPEAVAAWAARSEDMATVAIGGVDAANAHTIHGVDGICVVSAIMGAADPAAAARELLKEAYR